MTNPTAEPFIEISGDEDTVISGTLNASDIDGDVLSFSVFSEPSFGSVSVNPDGTFEYTPDQDVNSNFFGTDFFEVETSQGSRMRFLC